MPTQTAYSDAGNNLTTLLEPVTNERKIVIIGHFVSDTRIDFLQVR